MQGVGKNKWVPKVGDFVKCIHDENHPLLRNGHVYKVHKVFHDEYIALSEEQSLDGDGWFLYRFEPCKEYTVSKILKHIDGLQALSK